MTKNGIASMGNDWVLVINFCKIKSVGDHVFSTPKYSRVAANRAKAMGIPEKYKINTTITGKNAIYASPFPFSVLPAIPRMQVIKCIKE